MTNVQPSSKLTVLYVGLNDPGQTCLHRMQAMESLGHRVTAISTSPGDVAPSGVARARHRLRLPADPVNVNAQICASVPSEKPDVLWLDKGNTIRPKTLAFVKRHSPRTLVVGYSPDDMYQPHNTSIYFVKGLPLYDLFFTTKSYGVTELQSMGCRRVQFIDNAFDPSAHRPIELSQVDRERLGGAVGFIGHYERERAQSIDALAQAGISVRVWGPAWEQFKPSHPLLRIEHHSVWGDEYVKAICAFEINLGFLRKSNRDLSTTRSIEIPACGAFMLAERTAEHQRLFEEGREAEFFADDSELLEKAKFYLAHPHERADIARRGRERCLAGGYSNQGRMRQMMAAVSELRDALAVESTPAS